jgi:hypothetical protein
VVVAVVLVVALVVELEVLENLMQLAHQDHTQLAH